MTTDPPPDEDLDADDEAVLAVLDDTATADQRRRVARDPVLRSRLAAQRAAAEAVAAPVAPLSDTTSHRLRIAALAALDAPVDEGDAAAPGEDADDSPVVVPLPPRRPARKLPPLPAVAAVVLLLIGVGLALILSDRSGGDLTAERSTADAAAEEQARDLGEDAATGGLPASEPDATHSDDGAEAAPNADASSAAELPRYPDEAALREALEDIDPLTLQSPTNSTAGNALEQERSLEQAAFCDEGLQAVLPELGPTQASLLVLVDDREVLVISNPVAATAQTSASTRLTALDARSCTPLFGVQR